MNTIEEISFSKKQQEDFLKEYLLLKFIPKEEYSKTEFNKIISKIRKTVLEINEKGMAIIILKEGKYKSKRLPKKCIKHILEGK